MCAQERTRNCTMVGQETCYFLNVVRRTCDSPTSANVNRLNAVSETLRSHHFLVFLNNIIDPFAHFKVKSEQSRQPNIYKY